MSQQFKYNPIQEVVDDGLLIPKVGIWGIEKYQSLGHYADLFTRSMQDKWGSLIYIDLFASSGYTQIKTTGQIIKSGALIALSIPVPFKKYIFCDEDINLLAALEKRVKRDHPEADVKFVYGNCNEKISEIIALIPKFSKGNTVLNFCFIDPFNLDIHFSTVRLLGKFMLDVLILIATGMAATRNETKYVNPSNETVANFLDDPNWRKEFSGDANLNDQSFSQFLALRYKKNMEALGYTKASDFHAVRYKLDGKNVLLYHLAFFSKSKVGNQFWDIVRTRYADVQTSLL